MRMKQRDPKRRQLIGVIIGAAFIFKRPARSLAGLNEVFLSIFFHASGAKVKIRRDGAKLGLGDETQAGRG